MIRFVHEQSNSEQEFACGFAEAESIFQLFFLGVSVLYLGYPQGRQDPG